MATRLLAVLCLWLTMSSQEGQACVLDCRAYMPEFDGSAPVANHCIDRHPSIVDVVLPRSTTMAVYESVIGLVQHSDRDLIPVTFKALDLSARGITSIASAGLACHEFVEFSNSLNYITLDDVNGQFDERILRGVLLDNNELTEVPNLIDAGLRNVSYISLKHNQIASFPVGEGPSYAQGNGSLMPFAGLASTFAEIDLSSNQITALHNNVLDPVIRPSEGTSTQTYAALRLDNNVITELPMDLLGSQIAGVPYVLLSVTNNQIQEIPMHFFDSYIAQIEVFLDSNNISTLPEGIFNHSNSGTFDLVVSIQDNNLTTISEGTFSAGKGVYGALESLTVHLNNNSIRLLPSYLLKGLELNGIGLFKLTLDDNMIETLPDMLFGGPVLVGSLYVSFNNNFIVYAGEVFSGFPGIVQSNNYLRDNDENAMNPIYNYVLGVTDNYIQIDLLNNYVNENSVAAMVGSYKSSPGALSLDFSNNQVQSLPSGLLAGVGEKLDIIASYPCVEIILADNNITSVSVDVFNRGSTNYMDFVPVNALGVTLDLRNNDNIALPNEQFGFIQSADGFQNMLNLTISFAGTQLNSLPLGLFKSFASVANPVSLDNRGVGAFYIGPVLTLDLRHNHIPSVNLSYPTGFSYSYTLTDIYFSPEITVNLLLQYNELKTLLPNSLSGFSGTVDLSHNQINILQKNTFTNNSLLKSINMSHNELTMLMDESFYLALDLTVLDVSHNRLEMISNGFTDNTPVLKTFVVKKNRLITMPDVAGSNRIFDVNDVNGNPLVCEAYAPLLTKCHCNDSVNSMYSVSCGYGRCLPTLSGCPEGQYPTLSCTKAPYNDCISECPNGQFLSINTLDTFQAVCTPYTICNTAFGLGTPAYEFKAPTPTSDRVCAPCSACPSGYHTSPCTATENSVCIAGLSGGDIAAIVTTILFVFIGTAGGTSYMFMRKKKKETVQELELSQLLLSDLSEDNERMRQAWEIPESHVLMKQKLASGSFGEVWEANWGHITVAVKVLHAHLMDSDGEEMEEFHRESTFMQSIRHPNLLIFYGAGIRSDKLPFIVTELMSKGSMRNLILQESLSWETRLRFATEIACGMNHLHSLGSMHRDLKSDNCLVDSNLHVKVADFGCSKLRSRARSRHFDLKKKKFKRSPTKSTRSKGLGSSLSDDESISSAKSDNYAKPALTGAVGTPLWMAPELIDTQNFGYGPEVDVYSFAIVMWELLACATPWDDEISARNPMQFVNELKRIVLLGRRPRLPAYANEEKYEGYVRLLHLCWAGEPMDRPSFSQIHATLISDTQL